MAPCCPACSSPPSSPPPGSNSAAATRNSGLQRTPGPTGPGIPTRPTPSTRASGKGERPPHDRVVTEQGQPRRKAAEGPLYDQEKQREDDAHQPQDAEAHRDQRRWRLHRMSSGSFQRMTTSVTPHASAQKSADAAGLMAGHRSSGEVWFGELVGLAELHMDVIETTEVGPQRMRSSPSEPVARRLSAIAGFYRGRVSSPV